MNDQRAYARVGIPAHQLATAQEKVSARHDGRAGLGYPQWK